MQAKPKLVQRIPFILEACAGKEVLHLGCTDYPYTEKAVRNKMLLHHDIERVAARTYGVDADYAGIEILRSMGSSDIYHADLEDLSKLDLSETFDVIVAGEIIEHLNNPGLFLQGITRFMREDTRLIITTVNAYCGFRFLYYGLRGRGGRVEPVHPDHVAYYSYSTLRLLMQRHGLSVDELLFYDLGKEHRVHNRWFLNVVNDACVRFARQMADGLIAVCSLRSPETLD